jgi:hypothetical protein
MRKTLFLLFNLIISFQLFSQQNTFTHELASEFIEAMINESPSIKTFVLPEELAISERLGITYEGVKNKFLISYEIPKHITETIKNKKSDYTFTIQKIDENYSLLNFEYADLNYTTKYYFKNEYLISPPYFYYKDWQRIESKHFIFYVSEPKFFNQYSIDLLENFVKNIFSVLNYSEEEKQLLKKEKLIYLLCKNEDEIENLTGYKARGMGNLAYDYVITTYNCHYHELLHILMNLKLKQLPLYTHPFLQEGFAVAFGGRGGFEPGVILNLGKFLEQSDFMKAEQLFNSIKFKNFDVSMTYPLSGLYSLFLINNIGIEKYLELYLKYSYENTVGITIDSIEFPSEIQWNHFVNNFSNDEEIKIDISEDDFQTLIKDSSYIVKEYGGFYLIVTEENILISTTRQNENYSSKIFNEFYPDKNYNNEKYLIRVSDSEVAVYNLFTNNLIANYVSGFSADMKTVPIENGYYKFLINQSIFNESPKDWIIKTGTKYD